MAAKKKAAKRSAKPAGKGRAATRAAKPSTPKKAGVRAGEEEVVYSDVRREMRSRLIGRLLGT